jgi:hypothetical protein
MSVSFDLPLGQEIRASAQRAGESVSAWLGEAARDRLRLEALGQALESWEATFGALGEAEVDAAGCLLDQADSGRPVVG